MYCLRPIQKIPMARTTTTAITMGERSPWFAIQRISPEKMDIAVGWGGGAGFGEVVGRGVAAVAAAVTGVFANRAKQQKWETSAVTVPDSGW